MDQFIVSARKYRPATFSTVVGQRHIAETLKNAIRSSHLAQAFLFCGPRGVGKTTCARILAKTINCFNRTESIEACEKCDSCKSFNEGHSLNIYELDAASNNSVEDIRGLIEKVRFAPQIGTKKVYIIDEVHMLSTQAFNAFLKTLEEPPSHAIFILATTEKHKVLPTILSRCQVFDFNRIEVEDITHHLEEIASKEGITAEHDGLHLIAQKSDGSLRDALSMFDQMVTYSGNELTYHAVVESLSILSSDYFFKLMEHFVAGEVHACLALFNEVLRKGFDGHNFILGLGEHMRNLLVAQDHSTIELLSVGKIQKDKFREQTLRVTAAYLIAALNLVSKADVQYKSSRNQRLLVELLLINLATLGANGSEKKTEVSNIKKSQPIQNEVTPIPKPTTSPTPAQQPLVAKTPASIPTAKKEEVRPETPVVTATIADEIAPRKQEVEKRNEEKAKVVSDPKPVQKPSRSLEPNIVSDGFSISQFTSPKAAPKKEVSTESEDDQGEIRKGEEVTEARLAAVWNELTSYYERENKLSLFATLKKYEPVLKDGHIIEMMCDNKAQLQAVTSEKTFMLGFLRRKLNNYAVQLNTVISAQEIQRAYTPAEKLEKLIEKNPNINLLREKLDLEIGH